MNNAYNTIYESLLKTGYTKKETEKLIADVVYEQGNRDYADRIYKILTELSN